MFGFFKNIKADIAAIKAKFEALEAKVEAYFKPAEAVKQDAAEQAPAPEVAPTDEVTKS